VLVLVVEETMGVEVVEVVVMTTVFVGEVETVTLVYVTVVLEV
jgi:hypothetical protein